MPKILALISSCGACPNYRYDSGGAYNCDLVGQTVRDKNRIAPFCPLADFPSRIIADLEVTADSLRRPNDHTFHWALMSFIADKLKAVLRSDGRYITLLPKKEGAQPILLLIDHITGVDMDKYHVTFLYESTRYAIVLAHPPRLLKEATPPGLEPGWQQIEFTVE